VSGHAAGDEEGGGPGDARLYFALLNEVGIVAQLSRALFEAAAPEGVSLPQFTVLNHLARLGDGRAPLAIAKAFQVPKPSMTHTLAALEARGLVETRPHPRDGRSKLVYLTEAGRAMRERCIAVLAPATGRIAAGFPPAEARALLPLLEALRRVMDADRERDE
jgi:DNA-binding MarR family transcriptional regulator